MTRMRRAAARGPRCPSRTSCPWHQKPGAQQKHRLAMAWVHLPLPGAERRQHRPASRVHPCLTYRHVVVPTSCTVDLSVFLWPHGGRQIGPGFLCCLFASSLSEHHEGTKPCRCRVSWKLLPLHAVELPIVHTLHRPGEECCLVSHTGLQAQQLKESGRTPPLPPGAQARGSSPPPKGAAGIQLPSSGMRGVSPSESKWFIPSAQAIVSLAAIQSEEAEAAAAVAAELAAAASLAAESGGQEKQRQEGPSRRRRGERKPEAELERGQWETRQGEAEGHPSPQLNPSQNRHRRPRQRKQPDADAAGGESERPQGEVEGEVPQQQAPFQNRQRRPRQRSSRPLKDNEGDAAGIKTPTGKATAKKANISPTHQGRGEKGVVP